MFREKCCDRQNEFNANFAGVNDVNMDVDINVANNNNTPMMTGGASPAMGNVAAPIIEPVQERVVQRTIMHEVPQDCVFM